MNISNVKVKLTGDDLLSILNEFVSIEELSVNSIDINDSIHIKGTFKKGVSINFEAKLVVASSKDGRIQCDLVGFKVYKIGILAYFRKVALKYALKSLADKGIMYDNGKVDIQYRYLLKDVPYVDFNVVDVFIDNGAIEAEVSDLVVSLGGTLKKDISLFTKEEVDEEEDEEVEVRGKTSDMYTVGRDKLSAKLPEKAKKYSDYIFVIPDIAALIYRLLKDNRVPLKTKLVISGAAAYIAFPTDIIPDKIPFVGKVDELAVGIFAINRIVNDIPLQVVLENWQGKNDIILVIKNIIEYATNFTNAQNVENLFGVLEELLAV